MDVGKQRARREVAAHQAEHVAVAGVPAGDPHPLVSRHRPDDEATVFDSTGLAIQDLALALAALERLDELDLPRFEP